MEISEDNKHNNLLQMDVLQLYVGLRIPIQTYQLSS